MEQGNPKYSLLSKIAMSILTVFPILDYYYVGESEFTIARIAGLLLFVVSFIQKQNRLSSIPRTYWLYWGYSAFQVYFIAGIGGWSDYIPGGVNFAIFSLCLFGMAWNYSIDLLHKYMKWFFIFASVLWLFQYSIYISNGMVISVFLPLTDNILPDHKTYQEILLWHNDVGTELIARFSSVFSEPSHFAQYMLFLLAIELFKEGNRNKLYTRFSIYIVIMLFFVQSGAGFLGLGFLGILKLFYIVLKTRQLKYYLYLFILIPTFIFAINYYLNSSSGAYVSARTEQLDYTDQTATNSGFVRMYFGWYRFFELSPTQKLLGTSRTTVGDLREGGFFNGVTYTLCSQGLIGLLLLALFFYKSCRGRSVYAIISSWLLFFISLIASTYLGGLMLIVSSIALGVYINNSRD